MSSPEPLSPRRVSIPAGRPSPAGILRAAPPPALSLTVLLVDADARRRAALRRALEPIPGVRVEGECSGVEEAVAAIRRSEPGVVFVEVDLDGRSGFEVLEALAPAERPSAVFVTSEERHAARAFESDAADCVVRPFAPERIAAAVARTRERRPRRESGARRPVEEWLLIKKEGRSVFVRVADIDWIESARNNVILHVAGERYIHHETTSGIEGRLSPNKFLRIHRSAIVRIDRIKELVPWFNGDYRVTLRDGTQLTLSESYRDRLKRFRR
jgi:two-component system LytT family response regulator